ncbi:putative inactive receptor kinase [Dorcoceras hygrometricum]|uniref:Putative inactive receptor kinase n=1 Tax=Dorcoceras hygrometricum TaxID=472368 RepID=A0A2Z7CEY2_9LAMI|nr:putative inactive receptor kinase [Dorcoceras hygrometricum]
MYTIHMPQLTFTSHGPPRASTSLLKRLSPAPKFDQGLTPHLKDSFNLKSEPTNRSLPAPVAPLAIPKTLDIIPSRKERRDDVAYDTVQGTVQPSSYPSRPQSLCSRPLVLDLTSPQGLIMTSETLGRPLAAKHHKQCRTPSRKSVNTRYRDQRDEAEDDFLPFSFLKATNFPSFFRRIMSAARADFR